MCSDERDGEANTKRPTWPAPPGPEQTAQSDSPRSGTLQRLYSSKRQVSEQRLSLPITRCIACAMQPWAGVCSNVAPTLFNADCCPECRLLERADKNSSTHM